MNGRIFSCWCGNGHCENSWAKNGGSRIGEPRGPKKWGIGPSGQIGVYTITPYDVTLRYSIAFTELTV